MRNDYRRVKQVLPKRVDVAPPPGFVGLNFILRADLSARFFPFWRSPSLFEPGSRRVTRLHILRAFLQIYGACYIFTPGSSARMNLVVHECCWQYQTYLFPCDYPPSPDLTELSVSRILPLPQAFGVSLLACLRTISAKVTMRTLSR